MVALRSRCEHYIFILWCLLSFFFLFPSLISAVADWMSSAGQPSRWALAHILVGVTLHAKSYRWCGPSANLECRSEMCCTRLAEDTGRKKSPFWYHRTTLSRCIFAVEACIENRKTMLNTDTSSTCPDNMVNFGLLTAEICWRVWGTPANFNGFRVLAASLHGTLVVGVSQTLWR